MVPESPATVAGNSACTTTTEVGGSTRRATTPPSIQVVAKTRATAAEGDHGIDAPRLPVPLGATEAVLDPTRLFAPLKRAPHAQNTEQEARPFQKPTVPSCPREL